MKEFSLLNSFMKKDLIKDKILDREDKNIPKYRFDEA
jgi:hypothetical protein